MMHKVLYFSTRYPAPLREGLVKDILFSDSASAVVFSDAIFHGLVQNGLGFVNVNNPPIGYWPRMNKKLRIPTIQCYELDNKIWNIGSVNIYVYQYFSTYWNTFRTIKKELKGGPAICLVYSINVPVIRAILRYRRRYAPNTKIVLVIPDLIEDMYSGRSLKSIVQRWLHGNTDEIYRQMDGFVYLTEQMKEITKSDKPYTIVEGIYDLSVEHFVEPDFNREEKVVFYSGKLEEKFGARLLVDAFCMMPDTNARLVLCGSGDSEEYIKHRAVADSRIIFKGQIARDEVLRLQSNARLLVNPRTSKGAFTRYSFPSKNIQYLASSIPTLIYRLEGIPDEYYRHCLSIEDASGSTDVLSHALQKGINLPPKECLRIGRDARSFILEQKNAKIQCKKIIDLIKIVQEL